MKILRYYFWLAFIFWTIFSATFLIMPVTETIVEGKRMVLIAVSTLFWVSFVFSIICIIILKIYNRRLNRIKKIRVSGIRYRLGLFCNIPELVANILFLGSIIASIIFMITKRINEYAVYVNISVFIYSIGLHFLFEDTLYRKIISKNRK